MSDIDDYPQPPVALFTDPDSDEPERSFTLSDHYIGDEAESVWVTVRNINVCIRAVDEEEVNP